MGPTASGKTGLAVELAKAFDGEIVSGDAFQIYREMSIGTAKPTGDEMAGIPHHLVDCLPVSQSYSLGRYLSDARAAIGDIHSRGKLPIICGGTGLYITHLVDGTSLSDTPALPELRNELAALALREGNGALYAMLQSVDPELAASLHPNNVGRIIRALEVHAATGRTQSAHKAESKPVESPYTLCMIGITAEDRQTLYSRINRRVDTMMDAGLLAEVSRVVNAGWSREAAQAIGYKELLPYLEGHATLDSCTEALKQATRRYAKRQLTWFKRDARIRWLYIDETDPATLIKDAKAHVCESLQDFLSC